MKNKKLILGIFIGTLIGGMIGVKASELISSSQVIYKEDKTVANSLDSLFTELSDGKLKIADAITEKGVETSSEVSLESMAENIALIENSGMSYRAGNIFSVTGTGSTITKTENVTIPEGVTKAYVILSGTTNYSIGIKVTGNNILTQTSMYKKSQKVTDVYYSMFEVVELDLDGVGGDITITAVHIGNSNTYSSSYYTVLY